MTMRPGKLVILHRTRTSGTCPECGRTTKQLYIPYLRDIGITWACYHCSLRTTAHPIGADITTHEWIRSNKV